MANIRKALIVIVVILGSIWLLPAVYALNKNLETQMSEEEYKKAIQTQNRYHSFYKSGKYAESKENYALAVQYYERGLEIVRGYGPETIFRSALKDSCEKAGYYEKALEHTRWFLTNAKSATPLTGEFLAGEQRLLQKIEKQRSWELKQDPVVPDFREAFDQADNAQQERMLESLGGQGVWDIFKDAMVAEHGGDFEKAREIYESLLPRKEEIDTQMGTGGWAMLYPAIQRTSELLGDDVREKEALIWIKDNLLNGEGQHHGSLKKLRPEVVLHIQKRIEKFQL
ncbi:MAG: hypothetical protein ACOYJW_07675 [Candidatus Omnitrophota bacterium]